MAELARKDLPVTREVWPRDKAVQYFKSIGERYKRRSSLDSPNEEVSLYREGDFIDLCRGPHVPSTGKLKVFKLTKVAGAYWRGDSKNEMLQRIYGTAWAKKEEQEAYLRMIEEAEKRDHRRLGTQLDLFHLQEEARAWCSGIRKAGRSGRSRAVHAPRLPDNGYLEVRCPQILDRSLWEKSGHWQNYRENMFTTESEKRDYAIKPMNCPGHVLIYNKGLRSYRELPLRYGEFGVCTRNEPSGALHGIMRIRAFTRTTATYFAPRSRSSRRSRRLRRCCKRSTQTSASPRSYTSSRRALRKGRCRRALGQSRTRASDIPGFQPSRLRSAPGRGRFLRPKIEYHLKDSIGRSWQCGTMQVDFSMPGLLGAEYVAEDNSRKVPVMLHRAIVGSMERFIGILIEHYAGAMPLWLAPVQIAVLNISEGQAGYAARVATDLKQAGWRCEADLRNEKITYKISGT